MFQIKPGVDVLRMLSDRGYSSYRIRQEKIMGEKTLQKFRDGKLPSWNELDKLCSLLNLEPWDIIEYIKVI